MRGIIFFVAAFAAAGSLCAQPFVRHVEPFPVRANGALIALPFAGGVNSPQHHFADIDNDGDADLFVFDVDLTVDFYRNEGTRFAPAFKLRNDAITFPPFQIWFQLVDYDGDGKLDFCTEDSAYTGIKVYRNTGTFESPQFTTYISPILDTTGESVYAGGNSIPVLVDIDGDGDLDIISPNTIGSVNFYRNTGTRSQPRYAYIPGNWQNILIIGDSCTQSQMRPLNPNHGAAAYSFADIDGDGDLDMFVGDLFWTGLFSLTNTGTAQNPVMQCGTAYFPPGDPVNTVGFNQTSFVDIDGDGDLDMFIGVLGGIVQSDGFLFYRNEGTTAQQNLRRVTSNFLSTIDVGMNARPAFVDIDGDGDLDMFAGNLNGHLVYFRNTGTPAAPDYTLQDSIYLSIPNGYYFTPAFVDVDGDGDKDLFAGMYDGSIKFFRNTGTPQTPQFVRQAFATDAVDVINNAVPAFVDLDNDGDLDLIVGRRNGRISFYRNDGGPNNFVLTLVTHSWLGITSGFDGLTTPTFTDIDNDGDHDLFFGAADGRVEFWENVGTASSYQFVQRTDRYGGIAPALESFPVFADVDGDGDLDLFVGGKKGGIHYYRNGRIGTNVAGTSLPGEFRLYQNYPNPFNPQTVIRFELPTGSRVTLDVFDVLGRAVASLASGDLQAGYHERTFDGSSLSSGVYYYRLTAVDRSRRSSSAAMFVHTRKFILLR